ncbi:MAG: flagellar hook-associated protein FlgK [Brevinema sp.]
MISSFLGLEMGRGALQTSQKGLQTVSHNLNNLNTEGYTRQRATQKTMPALFPNSFTKPNMPGQLGTGVTSEEIARIRDVYLDDRIVFENGGLGFWSQKKTMLNQVEMLLNEPGNSNIRTDLEAFWDSWQSVADSPTDDATRIHLIERAKTLTQSFRAQHNALVGIQTQTNALVEQKINRLNDIAETLSILNNQIKKQELTGSLPNDLYDKRDLMIDELSKLADIRLERNNPQEFIVYIGAEKLVQGDTFAKVEAYSDPNNKGFVTARWQQTSEVINLGKGEISGLVEVRDRDVDEMITRLDSFAYGLMDGVNSVHREGFGLNGETNNPFFKEFSLAKNAEGSVDFNEDGVLDGTALFRITGYEKLTAHTIVGSNGTINLGPNSPNGQDIMIDYTASDTVETVVDRINKSGAEMTAFLDPQGRLSFKANAASRKEFPNFVIRHIEDSGDFLTGVAGVLQASGQDGAFNWQNPDALTILRTPRNLVSLTPDHNSAGWMALDTAIEKRPEALAAAGGFDTEGNGNPDTPTGFNDNRNSLAIANLRFETLMTGRAETFADYFEQTVAKAGTLSEQAIRSFDKTDAVSDSLTKLRTKISGVSVDDEMAKMITFQHAYNAAARLVSTTDRLLDVIINRMGV